MDSGIGGSHSSMIDETSSEIETERRSASYYRDNEKCGTSLKRWGDKGLKSSLSFSDVYMEFANTSSNNLSPEYSASCPDLEDIFNSSKHSFQHNDENLKALEECQAQTKMDFEQEEEKKIECLKEEEISVPNVSSIKDQRSYFQRNYKKFIKDLEPSNKLMDEIISFECRDKYLSERIREAKSRKRRADILIKYAARYLDKDSFESLLKKADHAHLINKLKTGSTQEACTPTGTEVEDRSHLLCNEQFKQLLMDEIEPLDIIDSLVVNEVLSFVDHEDILVTNFRRTRVENLMKYIDKNPERNFIYFFKLLKKYYRDVIKQFDTCDTAAGCERTSDFNIITRTGHWNSPELFSIDESAEIEFHVELSPPSSDVEMEIVEESVINMETENEIRLLDLQFKSMHLGSIVIVHRQLTDQVIRKLQEACHTGEINRYIKSLFTPEYVEKMRRDGVTGLVLKITAKKSQQEEQKLLKQMKITQETMCWNETYLASEIPDTTRNVTGRELQENASFLLDELEPKEYVQAFDSILPQDVLVGLTADIDRRKRVKLFVDEIVEKGQQAVDIFVGELERLERHHVLNILKGSCTNTSGINIDQIAFQIRTSIVNNYDIFVDELEPKRYATFCMEKRTMDKAAYEKICKHPSRRNRAVAFFKWLLDEQKPDAYIAFQKAVGIFSSDKFVKLLETTVSQSTSGVTSPAADHVNDDASTRVLLYLATSEITFSKDATCSASRQNQGEIIRAATDDATPDEINETSSETYMLPNPTVTVNDEKHENKLHKHERDSEPGLYAKTLRCIQLGQALFRKSTSQWRPVRINQRGTKQLLQSPEESHSSNIDPHIQKMTEEKEKLVVSDVLPNSPDKEVFSVVFGNEHNIEVLKYERDRESRPLNDTTLHSIPNITFKKKVPKWLSEKSRNNSTTHCFSLPENTNSSNDDHDKHLLHHQIETTSSELVSDPKTESEEVLDSSTNKEGKEEWDGQSSKTETCTQVYIQNPNMDEEGTISTCVDSVLDLSSNEFNHSLPAGSMEGAKNRCHSPDSSHSSRSRKRHYQIKDLIPKETISHHEKVRRWLLLDVTNDFDSCASPPISNDLATIQGKPLSDSIGTTHGNLSGGSKAESGVIPGAIQDGKSNKSYKDIVKKEHKTSIANVIVDDNVSVSDQGYISHQDHNDFDQATISSSASSKFDTSSVKTTESNSTMREESELGPIDVSLIKLQSFRINSSKLDQTQYYSTMKRCADIKDQ